LSKRSGRKVKISEGVRFKKPVSPKSRFRLTPPQPIKLPSPSKSESSSVPEEGIDYIRMY